MWLKNSHTRFSMETAVVINIKIISGSQIDCGYSFFFLAFVADDMLIAYTVSDGTHLIFGGELKPATSHMYTTVIDKTLI